MCKTAVGICPEPGLLSVSQVLALRRNFPRQRGDGATCSLIGQYWKISSILSDNRISGVLIPRFFMLQKKMVPEGKKIRFNLGLLTFFSISLCVVRNWYTSLVIQFG